MSRWLLLFVLTLALALRLWGVFYDLPYVYHPDEPHNLRLAQGIFKSGDLNPHWFEYPSLFYYINAAAYVPYYLIGKALGAFTSPSDVPGVEVLVLGTAYAPLPSVVALGRLVSILFGLGVVLLAYLVGRRLGGSWVGGLGALFVAISSVNVLHSRILTPDTSVTFWVMATLLAATYVLQEGKTRYYVLAAVAAGLTASTKYNGALVFLTVVAAHFLRVGWVGFKDWRIYLAPVLTGLTFVTATPFAVLDYPSFSQGLLTMLQHYSTGHAGMEGDSLRWYIGTLWKSESLIMVLAVVQMVRGGARRHAPTLLLSVFPVAYFIVIANVPVRNDRTLLPLIPCLDLLAALLLVDVLQGSGMRRRATSWRRLLLGAPILVCVALSLATTIHLIQAALEPDGRAIARAWITENLPPGSPLALESYAPFVPPDRYRLTLAERIIDHPPAWYREQGVEYLIFASGMFARFYDDPDRYAQQVAAYDAFFNSLPLLKQVHEGNYEMRVYRLPPGP